MSRFVSEIKGVLVYPKEKKKEELILDDEKIKEIESILEGILHISALEKPPIAKNKNYCKKCSFYELCMV